MDCDTYREILSADLDGEATPLEAEAAAGHLTACAECAAWQTAAASVTRATRLSVAEPVPDLTAAILSRPTAPPVDNAAVARIGLALAALAQVLVGLGALLADGHLHREHGVWELALAIGFATAAWRPARAAGLVPLVAALVVGLCVTASVDAADGAVALLSESNHLVPIAGLALLLAETRSHTPATA